MPLEKAQIEQWKEAADSWERTGLVAQAEVVRALLAEVEWLEVLARMLNELVNSNSELVQNRDEMLVEERAQAQELRTEIERLRRLVSTAAPVDWLAKNDVARAQSWEAHAAEALR